ncbi:trypsin-7-like [Diabrotica virgifera virgifera]|uniref:Peptidase S1 domain-containing protein n=1 Tax=Diabrotica virgifera virgifera TaxID=50390 RepID=A0ABM5K041_DIAVI|nr:trypsin-7-like [Diabrotica virgifera virgifera]
MNLKWKITLLVCTFFLRNNVVNAGSNGHFRIFGGKKTIIERHPWMVSLQFPLIGHFCAGSLINKDTVITAAHCLNHPLLKPTSVLLGTADQSGSGTTVYIKTYKLHENFSVENADENHVKANNDIAFIKLEEDVKFSKKIQPIKLPEQDAKIPKGTSLVVAGWAKTSPDGLTSKVLRDAKVTAASHARLCDSDDKLCAGNRKSGVCEGDSGGPLELNGTLVGIVSFGEHDCVKSGDPSVYANVAFFRTWIKNEAGV